jgi:hypothetical protein
MSSGRKSPRIGEVHILGDKEPALLLRRQPNLRISTPTQMFVRDSINIMLQSAKGCAQAYGQVFVKLDPHRACGAGGAICGVGPTGKSSVADAAANSIAA